MDQQDELKDDGVTPISPAIARPPAPSAHPGIPVPLGDRGLSPELCRALSMDPSSDGSQQGAGGSHSPSVPPRAGQGPPDHGDPPVPTDAPHQPTQPIEGNVPTILSMRLGRCGRAKDQ